MTLSYMRFILDSFTVKIKTLSLTSGLRLSCRIGVVCHLSTLLLDNISHVLLYKKCSLCPKDLADYHL